MHESDDLRATLTGLDLNLLPVLDALLSERHVTRAGRKVGLSQSATSHALSRLRAHFDDPLLVRHGNALVPTSRAEALAPLLARALQTLASALAPPERFDPLTARRTFVIACADYGQLVLLPRLVEHLTRAAPHFDLVIRDLGATPFGEALGEGRCDLAIGPPIGGVRLSEPASQDTAIYGRHLFDERFVCLVRRGHRAAESGLDLATFAALPHAFVAPRGTPGGIVDDVLARHGLSRRVAVMVQHFLVAPWLVARTDLVVTLAERLALAFVDQLPLVLLEPPIELPRFAMHLMWHERRHRDPAHTWLRSQLVGICAEV